MQTVTVVVASVLLWASSATAGRSGATQTVVEQCVSLGEASAEENGIHMYNEVYHVTKNPFLWNDSIPFDKMHPSMLVSAACELVQDLHAGLDELESETTASWRKVVEPLELLHDSFDRMTNIFELLAAVNQSAEMEAAVGRGKLLAQGFDRRLQQSTALFALLVRIRFPPTARLEHSHEQLQALDHWIVKMDRGGVNLAHNSTKLAVFNGLDDEETKLKRQFVHNVAYGAAAFRLTLRNGEHLRGVPRVALAAMAAAAQKHNLTYSTGSPGAMHPRISTPPIDGAAPTPEWGPWTVTFDRFVYDSMMTYCPNRRLRQLIYQSYESRASQAPWDNVPVVERLLQVRHCRARLLRSTSYAELVTRRRMASHDQADKFLDDILAPVASAALRTLLRIVRLMADSAARGENVWGDSRESSSLESSDLQTWGASGRRLAFGQSSAALLRNKMKRGIGPIHFIKTWGLPPLASPISNSPDAPGEPSVAPQILGSPALPAVPEVSLEALKHAEHVINNNTLSQPECVALLANVTMDLRIWDIFYWGNRLQQGVDSSKERLGQSAGAENLSTYFTLSRVLSGAFGLLTRLWGMHVVESIHDKPPVWHPDVRHFQLFNGTELLGSFFFDPFARHDKAHVPFTQILVKRSEAHARLPEKVRTPVAVMSTNIKAPGPGEPVLLQIDDILHTFHELGHVVQSLANQNNEVLIAGTTILPLDFSEMYAMFFESWATENSTLHTMAENYKTHAMMPPDKRKELANAMTHLRPLIVLEHLYISKLDLSLHTSYASNATETVLTHRQQVANDTLLLPYSSNSCDFCTNARSFEHGSAYFRYLWSEVHAMDAMGYFEEMGILNDTQVRVLGDKMAAELLVNGTQNDPTSQYERFRGRPASPDRWIASLS